jgi:hypothetical protein
MTFLARILSWCLRKLTFGVVLVIAGVVGFGAWIYLRDDFTIEQRRIELVRALNGQRGQMKAALADVEARMAAQRDEVAAQERRAREAARLIVELTDLNSGLNRLSASAEQVRLNEQRLARLRETEAEARLKVADLRQALTRAQWEQEGLTLALGRLEQQIATAEAQKSRMIDFLREAWSRHGALVLIVVAIWMLGPPLARLFIYFVVAPFVSSRQPVRLGAATAAQPMIASSGTALEIALEPGDVLWVKESFLQASDEALQRRTRWLLDWRIPLTCLAAGLKELVELGNPAAEISLHATLSSQQDARIELALLDVPMGASVVLRPSFLAGLAGPLGRRAAAIRKHWRVFALQSWATGQFRYFEFVGPCRLVLAGSRGVRAEQVGNGAGRRVNQDATVGFTPGLSYRPVRAETFWSYFRGQNPLFDDRFEDGGVVLVQQTSARGEAAEQRRFLAGMKDGLLRIFGL